ncbi:UNVERIFIED_CONTAM: hypothetical protein FKN15_008340 [Acipenser sinensis]
MLLIIIVSVGAFTIIVVVIVAALCTWRTNSQQKKKRAACKSANGSHKYKVNSKDLKPPDLWIHHERLELKPIDKSPETNPVMTETPIPHTSQDIPSVDTAMDSSILQRRNSYRGHESEDSMSTLAGRRGMRPRMMMPFDTQPPQPVISAHPIHSLDNPHHHYHCGSLASPAHSYPQHQLNPRPLANSISHIDRASSSESVRNTPSTDPVPVVSQPACSMEHMEPEASFLSSAPEEESSRNPPTAHVRPSHPLKSFAVPAVPPAAPFESPALPSTPLLTQTGTTPQVHSVKTASIGTLGRTRCPMPVTVPSAPDVPETSSMLEDAESVKSVRNTPSTDPVVSQPACSMEHMEPEASFLSSAPEEEPSRNPPTAHVRPSHPLKSFAVPAVPPAAPFESPALPSTPLLTQTGTTPQVHSVKTASIGTLGRTRCPMPVTVPSAPETSSMLEDAETSH